MANRAERRRGAQVNLEALFEDAHVELAASWDESNTADCVGYVAFEAAGAERKAGWLDRDGSAERLLRLAEQAGTTNAQAKAMLRQTAALVMQPHPEGKLRCVVYAYTGAALVQIEPELLRAINAKGQTPEARRARQALVQDNHLASLARQALDECLADGGTLEESVVIIADPDDPRARPMVNVIAQLTRSSIGDQHESGSGPTVAVMARDRLTHPVFARLRPGIASVLRGA